MYVLCFLASFPKGLRWLGSVCKAGFIIMFYSVDWLIWGILKSYLITTCLRVWKFTNCFYIYHLISSSKETWLESRLGIRVILTMRRLTWAEQCLSWDDVASKWGSHSWSWRLSHSTHIQGFTPSPHAPPPIMHSLIAQSGTEENTKGV